MSNKKLFLSYLLVSPPCSQTCEIPTLDEKRDIETVFRAFQKRLPFVNKLSLDTSKALIILYISEKDITKVKEEFSYKKVLYIFPNGGLLQIKDIFIVG